MTASRVIKLPRDDDESAYVLIQVVQKGSKPLDVKLVGTEGAAPYATTCMVFLTRARRTTPLIDSPQ